MKLDAVLFEKLGTYPHAVITWVDDDGYPCQTPALFRSDGAASTIEVSPTGMPLPADREVNFIVSHIRPQPGTGYDQRRYISLLGRAAANGAGYVLTPRQATGWDEKVTPFFEFSERSNEQAHRYLAELSAEQGRVVKPRLSRFWTLFLATRLPFLTATIVPVLLGIAIAAKHDHFSWWLALLTLIGGMAIHIGLNVANDVFDSLSGADEANVSPTQFSGGSRVIQHGLVTLRQMGALSLSAYAVGIAIGLFLVIYRGSLPLLYVGIAGVFLSVFYTAPPLRLVHHGLGEVTTALGFGPIMVLGAYLVQTEHWSAEPFVASIPVAILIALILYVNEIPDRQSDAAVGKRTLPVRLPADIITRGFLIAALCAFAAIAVSAILGVIPRPTLLALLALPLVFQIYRGIRAYYSKPYDLMATMGKNVGLHAVVGVLLIVGYGVAIAAAHAFDSPPGFLS
jgi:1,4-dihydroxy-2-naphthoate polyprenyltransferase